MQRSRHTQKQSVTKMAVKENLFVYQPSLQPLATVTFISKTSRGD